MSNNLIVGYTNNDESRGDIGPLFPFVDILAADGTAYTSFGSEPFTPNNELRYNTFQLQDNLTRFSTQALADVRLHHAAIRVGERVLPAQPERLRLQLAGRFLHRRERLPRQSEPHDVAGHAAPFPGALQQHPRTGQADPAAPGLVQRRAMRRTSGGREPTSR